MAKQILFAGKISSSAAFPRILGYLDCLIDQEILKGRINTGDIWKPDDIDSWFYGDEKTKQVLQSLSPSLPDKYVAFRAGVANEAEAERAAVNVRERFGLEFRLYENQ